MTLKQLIKGYSWLNIEAALLSEYPGRQRHLWKYEEVYQHLLLLPEVTTDLQLHLRQIWDEKSRRTRVEVTGRKQIPHITEARLVIPYSLHFTPWAEWLSMPVAPGCMSIFYETDIIAHSLVEMTHKGFDEASIQAQAQNLCNIMDDMNAKTGNDASLNWEEIIKQLGPRR